jgi:hypothetical protein
MRGRDCAVAAEDRADRRGEDQVVGEGVKAALDPEIGVEGEGEDRRVRGQVAPGVVADQERRSVLRDPADVPDLSPEPDARQQPGERQVVADVVGIAIVEIGGQPAPDLAGDPGDRTGERPGEGLQPLARGTGVGAVPRLGGGGRVSAILPPLLGSLGSSACAALLHRGRF